MSLSDPLLGTISVPRAIYAVGLIVLFSIVFGFNWSQTVVVTAVVFVGESAELARPLPGLDECHFRLVLSLVAFAAGGIAYWAQGDTTVAAIGVGGGAWLILDALYSIQKGIRSDEDEVAGADSSELFLSMQVGHLIAEELNDCPKTVPELADACDTTESRVREALDYHNQPDTAYRKDGQWHLNESKLGVWAFARDNTRRALARFFIRSGYSFRRDHCSSVPPDCAGCGVASVARYAPYISHVAAIRQYGIRVFAGKFERGVLFRLGLTLLSLTFYPIFGFGSYQYQDPTKVTNSTTS